MGVIQATEVVKLILGQGESLAGRLLLFDALGMRFRELKLRRNPACPACGDHPTVTELIDYEQFCGIPPETEEVSDEIAEISPTELQKELEEGKETFILDVRNPEEYDICSIEEAHLIPLPELMDRIHELDSAREMVVHCRSGMRSAKAIERLHQVGFRKLRNLRGGILAWADEVDPSMPKY